MSGISFSDFLDPKGDRLPGKRAVVPSGFTPPPAQAVQQPVSTTGKPDSAGTAALLVALNKRGEARLTELDKDTVNFNERVRGALDKQSIANENASRAFSAGKFTRNILRTFGDDRYNLSKQAADIKAAQGEINAAQIDFQNITALSNIEGTKIAVECRQLKMCKL